jgi:hypothetical protein
MPGTTPSEETHGGYDQIISPIEPINQMTKTYVQRYTEEATWPFKNIPSCYAACKHLSVLEDYPIDYEGEDVDWSPAGEVITVETTSEEEGMIKA